MKYTGNQPSVEILQETNIRWDYIVPSDPAVDTNPSALYAKWLNSSTGEEFICTDNTVGANVWKSHNSIIFNQGEAVFNGTSSKAVVTGYSGVTGASPLTIEAVVRFSSADKAIEQTLVEWGDSADGAKTRVRTVETTGVARYEVGNGYKEFSTNIMDDQYHHLAFVCSGDIVDNVVLYIDGVADGSGTILTQSINTADANEVSIGHSQLNDIYGAFSLKDFRIWSVARATASVQDNRWQPYFKYHIDIELSLLLSDNDTSFVDISGNNRNCALTDVTWA